MGLAGARGHSGSHCPPVRTLTGPSLGAVGGTPSGAWSRAPEQDRLHAGHRAHSPHSLAPLGEVPVSSGPRFPSVSQGTSSHSPMSQRSSSCLLGLPFDCRPWGPWHCSAEGRTQQHLAAPARAVKARPSAAGSHQGDSSGATANVPADSARSPLTKAGWSVCSDERGTSPGKRQCSSKVRSSHLRPEERGRDEQSL